MEVFVKASLIRAIKTAAQAAIATVGTAAAMGEVNWVMVGSTALLAGILSVLTGIATGLPEVPPNKNLEVDDEDK